MPQTSKTKAGPATGKEGGHTNGSQDKRGRAKYALDAGALLDGILSETQTEARAEEQRIEQELQAKQSQEQRKAAEDAELRRRQAEAALAAEHERQENARYRREAVLRTMQDLEAEREAGSLSASGLMPAVPEGQRPIDYATHVPPITQSYSHQAIAGARSPWLVAALVAGLVVVVGGGLTTFFLLSSQPTIDVGSYPKVAPALAPVSRNALVVVGTRDIPRPEPAPTQVVEAQPTTEVTAATPDRTHGHGHGHGGTTQQDTGTNGAEAPPLNLQLDGSGIFDRGSE